MSGVRAEIRSQIAKGGDTSPAAVSKAVIAGLEDGQLRAALAVALPYLVRDEIRKLRFDSLGSRTGRGQDERAALADADAPVEALPRRYQKDELQRRREGAQQKIAKAHEKREREAILLRTPLGVGDQWKQLGDCTPADLRTIAKHHRKDASERTAKADGYERMAKALEKAGAQIVRDLSAAKVRELFGALSG